MNNLIIKEKLSDEIENEIENLGQIDIGSEEYAVAVEGIAKLYKLKIEEDKNFNECAKEAQKRQDELPNQYIKLGLEAAGIVLPLVFYAYWMKRGLKFEETGTFTSTTFKGLFNRFKPTK